MKLKSVLIIKLIWKNIRHFLRYETYFLQFRLSFDALHMQGSLVLNTIKDHRCAVVFSLEYVVGVYAPDVSSYIFSFKLFDLSLHASISLQFPLTFFFFHNDSRSLQNVWKYVLALQTVAIRQNCWPTEEIRDMLCSFSQRPLKTSKRYIKYIGTLISLWLKER